MATKEKKKKVRKARKPQPLPRSVKALLGYLTGTDMKLSRPGVPVGLQQQQQQQQQQPQAIRPIIFSQMIRREKPVGQTIASSPLASLVPVRPPPPQPTAPTAPVAQQITVTKERPEEEKKQALAITELNSKILDVASFQKELTQSNVLQKRLIAAANQTNFRNAFDQNIMDNKIPLTNLPPGITLTETISRSLSTPRTRPNIIEQQKMIDIEQGAYASSKYVEAVTNPEMTRKKTISSRASSVASSVAPSRALSPTQLEKQLAGLTAGVVKRTKTPKTKPVVIPSGIDPSSQISSMAEPAVATPRRGKSIKELISSGAPQGTLSKWFSTEKVASTEKPIVD